MVHAQLFGYQLYMLCEAFPKVKSQYLLAKAAVHLGSQRYIFDMLGIMRTRGMQSRPDFIRMRQLSISVPERNIKHVSFVSTETSSVVGGVPSKSLSRYRAHIFATFSLSLLHRLLSHFVEVSYSSPICRHTDPDFICVRF